MYLVELLLPVADNGGQRFPEALFRRVREELITRFGGLTSFSRAPAHGVVEEDGRAVHDDVIVMEVMTESVEPDWWAQYRRNLEERFRQDEILIRAMPIVKL